MCGIAGIISNTRGLPGSSEAEIRHMIKAQAYRGPDSSAVRKIDERAMLASARLRITDAQNEAADMPMVSPCGRYTIVYNGEVYNHLAIRRSLAQYDFRTKSDTETILAAWMTWGPDCLSRFEGMFAFCIYDSREKTASLVVDPSGQKFIYYLHDRNSFVFASEIESLITDPYREKSWDMDGLKEYVSQRMIIGSDTHIREIKKLEAGTIATLKAGGQISIRRYYTIPMGDQTRRDIPAITQDIAAAIQAGCADTFHLEVSAGLLLSGGIDSSAVAHYAQQAGAGLETYSIGFKKFGGDNFGILIVFDEFDHARFMADNLNTKHHELAITPNDYCDLIDRWVAISGEPLDSSEAPMLVKLFEEAGQHHRVMFCGSGPDEAFDGYGLGKSLLNVQAADISRAYTDRFNWNFAVDLDRMMPGNDAKDRVAAKMDGFLAPYRAHTSDPLQLAQLINLYGRCVSYEYRQMDVISMRYGVEVRSPLADTRLTCAAFDCDPALKQHGGEDKWIYKQALRGVLPDRIVDRKKVGFPTPIEFWFTDVFEERVRDALSPQSPLFTAGLIDERYIREIQNIRDPAYRCLDYRLYLLTHLMVQQGKYIGIPSNHETIAA